MKAIYINEFGGREKLIYAEDFPKPLVNEAEVLVSIKAASVNPVDWKIREGLVRNRTPIIFPAILGWDMAGVIEETGFGVSRFKKGDEVYAYARRPTIEHGTYAEYIAIPESYIALKPKSMSLEEASTVPLVGLTAHQSLKKANLQAGNIVLILAATGGVGSMAIQLAKIAGAKAIGLASSQNSEYIKSLGADTALNYDKSDWEKEFISKYPQKADIIFDCVGGEALQKGLNCIKSGGNLISITTPPNPELKTKLNFNHLYHFVEPNAIELSELALYIDSGKLKTTIHSIFPLNETNKAHELIEKKHTRGKIVLSIK
jgi:NADPH:quinone reductase-like Zn-dependent oxidoreductase